MPKTDIKLYSTEPSGKATTSTISDVNPDATNDELKVLGQMLNSFTRNRYDKTNRINTIQCDTEPGGGSQTATITLSSTSVDLTTLKNTLKTSADRLFAFTATYDGDGQLYAFVLPTTGDTNYLGVTAPTNNSGTYTFRLTSSNNTAIDLLVAPITIKIKADATDTYKAAEATFTITA